MERPLTQNIRPDRAPIELKDYERLGGYTALRKALGSMTPKEVVELVKDSNLRGRGGAGFPTGVKWEAMPSDSDMFRPRYMITDADEMEPGAFKDRLLMEGNPHQLLEGMIIGAFAADTEIGYIFVRREYT